MDAFDDLADIINNFDEEPFAFTEAIPSEYEFETTTPSSNHCLSASTELESSSYESPSKLNVNENAAHSSSPHDTTLLQLNRYEPRVISSPHDTRKYHAYQIGTDPHSLIEFYNWINITSELDDIQAITKSPPWHVTETCTFIIDLDTFNDRRDAFVDSWSWEGAKTYRTYGDLGLDYVRLRSKMPQPGKYCFVKRSWNCRQSTHIKKYLSCIYKPDCIPGHKNNPLENAERYIIIQCRNLAA